MFETRTTDELVRIVSAGGGFRLNAGGMKTEDLVRIASCAAPHSKEHNHGATIVLAGLSGRTTDELVRIASCGHGHVIFE